MLRNVETQAKAHIICMENRLFLCIIVLYIFQSICKSELVCNGHKYENLNFFVRRGILIETYN